jgi:ferritin-like metal-binding protein YciE
MIFENHPTPEGLKDKFSSNLHELYINKFMELYYWEMKMLDILTLLQTAVSSVHLQEKIALYQRKKGEQVERLQQAFILIDMPITGKKCDMIESMQDNCTTFTQMKDRYNDFRIYSMVLGINHFNQASYSWLHTLAAKLGYELIKEYLDENQQVEKEFNQKLTISMSCEL